MVIKNLENKLKLVGIICLAFLVGCIIISVSSICTEHYIETNTKQKMNVLDDNVPIQIKHNTM